MKKSRKTSIVFKSLLIFLTIGLIWSCNDDDEGTSPPNSNEDVYVAGGIMSPYFRRATYWKNGVPVTLNEGPRASDATDIFIKGSDIYVVGSKKNEQYEDIPVLWVNGIERLLEINGEIGEANSVFVSDTIYVGGYESNGYIKTAKLWVFSAGLDVTSPNGINAEIKSVYGDQGKIYMAGYEYKGDKKIAKYWTYDSGKPELFEEFALVQDNNSVNANIANSIVVKNNKVYVAGHDGNGAVLWTNNVRTNLNPTEFSFTAQSIFIKDNDLYVAGTGGDINTNMSWYWKNGELTNLSRGDAEYEVANSIAVGEENIYVSGYFRTNDDDWAVLWTNNNPEDLTKNKIRSWAHAVKVVKK